LQNLTTQQTDELHDDIEKYLALETDEAHIDFWTVGISFFHKPFSDNQLRT